jgi:hypothetical protein
VAAAAESRKWAGPSARQLGLLLLLFLWPAGCNPLRGCVESRFELEGSSRLPRWFDVDISAEARQHWLAMSYYSGPLSEYVDNTVFHLYRSGGGLVRSVTGRHCWHPATRSTERPDGTYEAPADPHYIVVTVSGVTEVIRHDGMNNRFAISDDPALIEQAVRSVAAGQCRGSPSD